MQSMKLLTALLANHINDEAARQAAVDGICSNPEQADSLLQTAGVADDATRNGLVRQIQLIVANDADRTEFVDARRFVSYPQLQELLTGQHDPNTGEFQPDPFLRASAVGEMVDARGFVTTDQLDARNFVTPDQIEARGFLTEDKLSGYGFMTGDGVNEWAHNDGNSVVRQKGMMAAINQAIAGIPTPGKGATRLGFAALLLVFLLGAIWFGSRDGFMSWGKRQDEAIAANKVEVEKTAAAVEKQAMIVAKLETTVEAQGKSIVANTQTGAANTQAIGDLTAALANEVKARRNGDAYSRATAKRAVYRSCISRGDRSDAQCRQQVVTAFGGKVSDATAKRWAKGMKRSTAKKAKPAKRPVSEAPVRRESDRVASRGPVGYRGRDLERIR